MQIMIITGFLRLANNIFMMKVTGYRCFQARFHPFMAPGFPQIKTPTLTDACLQVRLGAEPYFPVRAQG